jgi:hypothetical protein
MAYAVQYPETTSGSAHWGSYPNDPHFQNDVQYQEERAALGSKSIHYGVGSFACIIILLLSTQFLNNIVPMWLYIMIPAGSIGGVITCSAASAYYLTQESKLYQLELHNGPDHSTSFTIQAAPAITLPSSAAIIAIQGARAARHTLAEQQKKSQILVSLRRAIPITTPPEATLQHSAHILSTRVGAPTMQREQ